MKRALAMAMLLALAAYGLFWGRRLYIRSWFEQGPARALALEQPVRSGALRPVRVLLIDGLSARLARRLPALSRLCRQGLTLDLQVGFPSVSLPVQHVLWTGSWQDRSGVMFLVRRMSAPVFESLPGQVTRRGGNSVAVVESHPYIVTSFPFSRVIAPAGERTALSALELQQHSLAAAQSSAALVMIHFLAVDEAGHEVGSSGAVYRAEAHRADELLGSLLQVRAADQTLLVLSDHGHLPRPPGGHGGPEPDIARVRACLVGPGIPSGRRAAAVLPDLTRLLADRLNVTPPRRCQGRPLSAVLAGDPPPARQQLRWGWRAGLCGTLVAACWLGLLLWARRRRVRAALLLLPWGVGLSLLLVALIHGAPTLSRFHVYRSLPTALIPSLLPALLLPVLQLALLLRRGNRAGFAALALAACGVLPALLAAGLSGWPVARPPLWPHLSAWASTLGLLGWVWLAGLALAVVVDALLQRRWR